MKKLFPFRTIRDLSIAHKRVFLRADLNVPLEGTTIQNDIRLQAILPTIDHILSHSGKVILATHIGRPQPEATTNFFDENLSTKLLLEWFSNKEYKISREPDLKKAALESHEDFASILLLENLRFFNGEKAVGQESSTQLAKLLAQTADFYVNDAFGLIHRTDTSITLLPKQFAPDKRAFGLLVEKEATELQTLATKPKQPFVILIGGDKISEKLALLKNALTKPARQRPKSIIIGGGLAYTFLVAQGTNVGKSLVDHKAIPLAEEFLELATHQNVKVLLPVDHVVHMPDTEKHETATNNNFPTNGIGKDIGPITVQYFCKELKKAKTIFANGTMGVYESKDFAHGTESILQKVAQSNAYTVVGGGDIAAAVAQYKLTNQIDFVSTGGGATLAFLAAEDPFTLPGFEAVKGK
jgi:phosphoglycerate kinase